MCLIAALGIFAWNFGSNALARKPQSIPELPSGLEVETFSVTNERNQRIAGWLADGSPSCGIVVLAHGRGSSRTSQVARAKLFHDAGISVALFDFRGHGESDGDQVEFGFAESNDAKAVLEFATQNSPNGKVAGVGSSLGAVALTYSGVKFNALVLEEMYATLFETVVYRTPFPYLRSLQASLLLMQVPIRLGFSASDVKPAEAVKNIWSPTLVLAGTDDQYVDRDQSQRIYDGLAGLKELVWFEGAKHQSLQKYDPDLYQEKVVPFLKSHICTE